MAASDTFELALRMTPSHRNLAELCEPLSFSRPPPKETAFQPSVTCQRGFPDALPGTPSWRTNVRHPELVWAICNEVTVHQVRRYRCSIGGGRHAEFPSHYSNQAGRSHEPGDALATNVNAHVFEFGMNHRGAIRTVRALMNQSDFVGELGVRSEAFRWGTRSPCVVARLGDTERFAHDRSCMHCLVSSYESERRLGIAALS